MTIHTHISQNLVINEGYQANDRPESYFLTQNLVIDKQPLQDFAYLEISRGLDQKESLSVFELGTGTGSFLFFLLKRLQNTNVKEFNYHGFDISFGMLQIVHRFLKDLEITLNFRININLYSGVNCIDLRGNNFIKSIVQDQRFDLCISSQFEHYFPNNKESELANRLKSEGISFSVKLEALEFNKSLLKHDGQIVIIDDYKDEDSKIHENHLKIWDRYVVENFSNEKNINKIKKTAPELAKKLRKIYDPHENIDILLEKVKSIRERRRYLCKEENESLSFYLKNTANIFGKEVKYLIHPIVKNFFVIVASNN